MSETKILHKILISYGSHNFITCSSKVNCFALRTDLDDTDQTLKVFPNKYYESTGKTEVVFGSKFADKSNGKWFTEPLAVERPLPILITVQNRVRSVIQNIVSIVVLPELYAPVIQVKAKLTPYKSANYRELVAFAGQGNIIPIDKYEDYNIKFNTHFLLSQCKKEEVEDIFTTKELLPGDRISKPIILSDQDGVTKVKLAKQRKRQFKVG